MLVPLSLTAPEVTTLEAAAAQGPHPRMRRRAQAVLGHHRGVTMNQLATLYAVGRNAISNPGVIHIGNFQIVDAPVKPKRSFNKRVFGHLTIAAEVFSAIDSNQAFSQLK